MDKLNFAQLNYTVDSLLSQCLGVILNNLNVYLEDLDCFQLFPDHAKDKILRKFTSSKHYFGNTDLKVALRALAHAWTKHIDLTSMNIDDDILKILECCEDLRDIHLTVKGNNDLVTAEGLICFFKNKKRAYVITLAQCSAVTDNVLKVISENCPHLTGLDLSHCNHFTDEGLQALTSLEHLRWLNLNYAIITDVGIDFFKNSKSVDNIEECRVSGCKGLTKKSVNTIFEFRNLQIVEFGDTSNSTDEDSEKYVPPQLKTMKQVMWNIGW